MASALRYETFTLPNFILMSPFPVSTQRPLFCEGKEQSSTRAFEHTSTRAFEHTSIRAHFLPNSSPDLRPSSFVLSLNCIKNDQIRIIFPLRNKFSPFFAVKIFFKKMNFVSNKFLYLTCKRDLIISITHSILNLSTNL
jgi:hypothetical protein